MAAAGNKTFTVLWLDSNANASEENLSTQQKLFGTFEYVEIFENENDCEQFIRSKAKKGAVLIVSGRLSREIVPSIDQLDQVLAVYIYCMDKTRHVDWAKQYLKIKGIIVESDQLITQIQTDQDMSTKKKESSGKTSPSSSTNYTDSVPKAVPKQNDGSTASSHVSSAAASSSNEKSHPLEGYEKMPLVTLEEATAPLIEFVTDVEQMVWIVKQNCPNPEDDMTIDESASVMLYTMVWYPKENSFYHILNETLRSENHQQIKPWFRYLRLVFHALAKLPSIHQIIYRGTNMDTSTNYIKGNAFTTWEFLTCTSSLKTLENEETFGKTGQRTLCTIECQSGKDIKNHAFEQTKHQILLLPGRQFHVISSLNQGNELNIVQLKETNSPYSFE